MDILVCIKQVPGSSDVEVDELTGVLKRDGSDTKLNPYDLYALEMAFVLRECYGGTVRVLSMGPPQAAEAVREAVYMGADRGYLLSDRKFAGADVLATSYTISQGIRKIGAYDLILCGKQTTDGDTAQVGAELAEFLSVPHGSNVFSVESVTEEEITFQCGYENRVETQKLSFPCLLTAEGGCNTPRLPSYRRQRELEGEELVTVLSAEDFDDKDPKRYGLSGSPTQVERIFPPDKNENKVMLEGSTERLAAEFCKLLKDRRFID